MTSHRRNPSALVEPKLSVVIPVYNEKATIDEILRRVIDTGFRKEIVLVDDCSTDGTRQILEKMVQLQSSGAAEARDIALAQDADLEYDPRDYGKLLEPLLDGRADVVFGSRFLGGPQRVHYFWH